MSLLRVFTPHRRARALIDAKLDAERGEAPLSSADADWLDRHLSRCAACGEALEDRRRVLRAARALGTAEAPPGFAGRVMLRAKTRSEGAPELQAERSWSRPHLPAMQLVAGAAFVALLAVTFGVTVAVAPGEREPRGGVTTLQGGKGLEVEEAPHFVVRAPGLGAAKARREITQVVLAHRGTYAESGGAIVARIPRGGLVAVTQDLASRAAFRMTKADAGELPPELETIVIRFELE